MPGSEEHSNFLSPPLFQVSSEEPVFEAVIKWVRQDEASRPDYLSQLLQFVRLPLLSAKYITDVIDSEVRNTPCLSPYSSSKASTISYIV